MKCVYAMKKTGTTVVTQANNTEFTRQIQSYIWGFHLVKTKQECKDASTNDAPMVASKAYMA